MSLWEAPIGRGRIWQPRFYDFVVFSEHKRLEELRYIHRNPVKGGLVEEPQHWAWSSFRHYAYDEPGPVLVNEFQKPNGGSGKSPDVGSTAPRLRTPRSPGIRKWHLV